MVRPIGRSRGSVGLARFKRLARRLPLAPRLYHWYSRLRFDGSGSYWDHRYRSGGDSGAGSYGRLAVFKAEFLNRFVDEHAIPSVLELGCGDGNQLSLASYPSYTGLDVSRRAVEICRDRFEGDDTKRFLHIAPGECASEIGHRVADLSISLDVIYHLVEDPVFDSHMRMLFDSSRRFVVVYSSNHDHAEFTGSHVRHRRFTDWVEAGAPEWELKERMRNPYPFDPGDPDETSQADFYVFERRPPAGDSAVEP